MKLPGEPSGESWDPYDAAMQAREAPAFKREFSPEQSVAQGQNPFERFLPKEEQDPTRFEAYRPSLWERFQRSGISALRGSTVGVLENLSYRLLKEQAYTQEDWQEILDPTKPAEEREALYDAKLKQVSTEAVQEFGDRLQYRDAQWAGTPAAENTLEYAASITGTLAFGALDPVNLVPIARMASPAMRATRPYLSSVLDHAASNALLNVTLNTALQEAEVAADRRDAFDPWEAGLQAAIGAGVGVPFGLAHGHKIAAENAWRQFAGAPEPGKAPFAPGRAVARPAGEPPPEPIPAAPEAIPEEPQAPPAAPTPESLRQLADLEELNAAMEALFGENVGTRNLTSEQLAQMEDYITGSRDVPSIARAPRERVAEQEVTFPDEEHRRLFALGSKYLAEQEDDVTEAEAKELFLAFQGFVGEGAFTGEAEPIPGVGYPAERPEEFMRSLDDLKVMARDYAENLTEEAQKGRAFRAWDVLPGDEARAAWFESQRRTVRVETSVTPLPIGRRYQLVAPEELTVDAKRFQFKGGADEGGVTERLKGVKEWDPTKAGIVLAWQDKSGKLFVADGHQRVALAAKLKAEGQDPKLLVHVLRENEGVTADDARIIAAAKNIAEGTGTAIDAAKILRQKPGVDLHLPPTSALVRDAAGLAKLSDDAFGMVVNEKVKPQFAAVVGQLAPDQATHAEILGVLAKQEPESVIEAESIVRDVLEAPAVQATMTDLFGTSEQTQILYKERAQVLSAASAAVKKDRQAFGTLVREEQRIAGAGNVLKTDVNIERSQQDAAILQAIQSLARRKGPVAEALAGAAQRIKAGEPKESVVGDFVEAVRREAGAIVSGRGGAGAPGPEGEIAATLAPGEIEHLEARIDEVSAYLEADPSNRALAMELERLLRQHGDAMQSARSAAIVDPAREREAAQLGAAQRKREAAQEVESIPVRSKDLRPQDRILDMRYGYITVEKVFPFDPKYPNSQLVETDRGRRDFDPDRVLTVKRPLAESGAVELGAEGKPQLVIPGAEQRPTGEVLTRRAAEALKPKVAQKPMDEGLLGDEKDQGDFGFLTRPTPPGGVPSPRAAAGVTMAQPTEGIRLEDIANDLSRAVGAPVRAGRLSRSRQGGAGKVLGQYDRRQGVVRLREMADFETRVHETAHAMETEYGTALDTLKKAHATELEPMAYPGAAPKQLLSEGFAEWFRLWVSNPAYVQRHAPTFTAAWDAFMRQRNPRQLATFYGVQSRYNTWTHQPSALAVAADVVSTRRGGSISEAVSQARRDGWRVALGRYMDKGYTATLDARHPIRTMVDELMKVYEQRTGKALDLKAAENPYILARMFADVYSPGHIDAMHGVVPYHGTLSQGPGISDALRLALGDQWGAWDDTLMADFAAYLISRRSIQEYARFRAGEIPNLPGKFTEGDYRVTVDEMEAQHPEWSMAADLIYEWNRNMLTKKFESGILPGGETTYRTLMARADYVPLHRDLTDLDIEPSVSAEGTGRTLRNSILKAFRGSKRSVINPVESMLNDSYATNAVILQNEIAKTLDDLAQATGPGSGKFVERIPNKEIKGTTVNVEEVLRQAAKDAGLNPMDIDQLTSTVNLLMGDTTTATIFRMGDINEKGEPIIYGWRNGERFALRLADGEFGRDVYNSLTGMGQEARNLFTSIFSLPSTALRYGITTAPHFIVANYIRDQVSAWVLTGNGFVPFISGARGITDELRQTEITQIYNSFWGLMGGANVAALDKGRARRDINALNKRGYAVKRFASWRGLAEFTEISETGTRLGIFRNAFARAKKDGFSDYESAVEAAYTARDYIDFGRHGSQMLTARRLVPFLNASLQGLDKVRRALGGEGAVRKLIAPYVLFRAGRPLTRADKANLALAASAWAKVTAIGVVGGLGLSYLYADDPEYEEISDYLKATHWMVKRGQGQWWAIPKPFELGFISNLFERSFDAVYKRDPIALRKFIEGVFYVSAPPTEVPAIYVPFEIWANKAIFTGAPITPEHLMGLDPAERYTGFTSALAKELGAAVGVAPTVIDHVLQGFGGSWGKIIKDGSADLANEKPAADVIIDNTIGNRFLRDVSRGATSTRQFWDMISERSGSLARIGNTYVDAIKNKAEGEADRYLEGKSDSEVSYALLQHPENFEAADRRLHPMERAKDAIGAISAIRRELASNSLKVAEKGTYNVNREPIILTPGQRQHAQELLGKLEMMEARNAFITVEEPGFAHRKYMDTASLLKDIETAVPMVFEELLSRYDQAKVYDDLVVREVWPEVKLRLLEDREDADLSDLVVGAR